MKKLSRSQIVRREALGAKMRERETILAHAVNQYNIVAEEIRAFVDDIINEMDAYEGERSDKWQETDAGNNFMDWKQEYEAFTAEDINLTDDEIDISSSFFDLAVEVAQ